MASRRATFGRFTFDPDAGTLLDAAGPVPLGGKALAILAILVEADGALVPTADLVARVWPGRSVDAANLRVHVAALRAVLATDPAGGETILNVPGRGYGLAIPVRRGAAGAQPAAAGPAAAPTGLFGRDGDLALVLEKLSGRRFVTLVGPGGIGKTSLAKAVADRLRADHRDGAVFVDLAAVAGPGALLQAVAAAVAGGAAAASEADVAALLAGRDLLLVLDGCEGVVDAAAGLAESLRRGAAAVDLLCTSREALRAEGEWLHRLAPLAVPAEEEEPTAADVARFPALDLFLARARAVAADVPLDPATLADAAAVCRALDGIPLALELAAATVGVFGLADLRARLADRFALLNRGRRTAPPRHRTLRATLDHSYDLLSSDERALLDRLGLFAGAFSLPAAAAVSGIRSETTETLLGALEAKSLVVRDDGSAGASLGPPPHFRLLETTALYAREKLLADPAADAVLCRHLDHLHARLSEADAASAPLAPAARRGLQANVETALRLAAGRPGCTPAAVALTAAAVGFWLAGAVLVGQRAAIEQALRQVAESAVAGTAGELDLRTALGLAEYYEHGPTAAAIGFLETALALATALGEEERRLDVMWMLFGITGNAGDYHGEAALAEAYAGALGDDAASSARFRGFRMTGRALHDLGRHGEAEAALTAALAAGRERDRALRFTAYHNDHWTAARSSLARLLWVTGRVDAARAAADASLEEAIALDHAQSLCWALAFNLVPVAIWCGDLDRAERDVDLLLQQSRRTFRHWHDWGRRYALTLRVLRGADEAEALRIAPATAAEADLLATFHPAFLRHDPEARLRAGRLDWCTAEHLRAAALRAPRGAADVRDRLRTALDLATRQGAQSFALRAATDLAGALAGDGGAEAAAAVLRAALAPIGAGGGTADLRRAATLLDALDPPARPDAAAAPTPSGD